MIAFLNWLDGVLWGVPLIALMILTGLYFTILLFPLYFSMLFFYN